MSVDPILRLIDKDPRGADALIDAALAHEPTPQEARWTRIGAAADRVLEVYDTTPGGFCRRLRHLKPTIEELRPARPVPGELCEGRR